MSPKKHRSMAGAWEHIRTVPGLKRDVTALAVLIIAAVVSAIGIQQFVGGTPFWADRFALKVEFEQVPGLNPNATPHVATIAGVRVGDITSYEATDRGTAIVNIEMEPEAGTIYDNASAVLRPKNPLNDMQVTIFPGGPPGKPLQSGGLIPLAQTKRPIQVNEVLEHLDERSRHAVEVLMSTADVARGRAPHDQGPRRAATHLDERSRHAVEVLMSTADVALASAPKDLGPGLAATDRTLTSLRPAMEALQVRRENIARLVTALGDIAHALGGDKDRAAKLATATQETLKVIAANDRELTDSFNQFPGLSTQLRSALSATQDLTKELNPTLRNLSAAEDELPEALDRFTDTAEELRGTMDEARDFVSKAKPVVADLRPFTGDASEGLDDLTHVTRGLDHDTEVIKTYLAPIQAFFYNTSSVFGAGDPQGGNIRGHVEFRAPDATHALPGGDPGYAPGPEGGVVPGKPRHEVTPIPPYVPGSPEYNDRANGDPNAESPDIRDRQPTGGN